jgi:hypothetical protein
LILKVAGGEELNIREYVFPLGDRLLAAPVSALWT